MVLSRLKATSHFQATKQFVGREDAQAAFSSLLDHYVSDRRPFTVLNYYGVGGIGKSALIRNLYEKSSARDDVKIAFVDLEAPQLGATYNFLLEIWRQLRLRCPRFEYALTRVLTLEGRSLSDVRPGHLHKDSLLYDLQEVALGLAETVAPGRLLKKLFDIADEKRRRYLSALKDDFEQIEALSEAALIQYLPHYLGSDLAKQASEGSIKFLVFLDSIDAIFTRPEFRSMKSDANEWLRELIGSAEQGLFVLAGRNSLRWADRNTEWHGVLKQYLLQALSPKDCDNFLACVPIRESEIRQAIIDSSNGVPLYLDLCANTYLTRVHAGDKPTPEDFRINETEVVHRFLAHLDIEHQEALRAISILDIFDAELFGEIVKTLNIHLPVSLFAKFCEISYATPVVQDAEFYRIHDLVRAYLRNATTAQHISAVGGSIVSQMAGCLFNRDVERLSWLFNQAYVLFAANQLQLSQDHLNTILNSGIFLVDAGRWNSVHGSVSLIAPRLNTITEHSHATDPQIVGSILLRGYCHRKRGELIDADLEYKRLRLSADVLGSRRKLFLYLQAHNQHLLGDYKVAAATYRSIIAQSHQDADRSEVWRLARRQLADIEMLEGHFRKALSAFQKLQEELSDDPLWQAEISRFRGHVYRFNFQFDNAQKAYEHALTISRDTRAEAMEGKALTNLAEVFCWSAPSQAMDFAKRAIQRNLEITAPIEVGKAYAARAISLALSHSFSEAVEAADQAVRIHSECKYRAGPLFGLQALGIIQVLAGDQTNAQETLKKMENLISETAVYPFLPFVLDSLLHGETKVSVWKNRCRWLDFTKTKLMLRSIFVSVWPHSS